MNQVKVHITKGSHELQIELQPDYLWGDYTITRKGFKYSHGLGVEQESNNFIAKCGNLHITGSTWERNHWGCRLIGEWRWGNRVPLPQTTELASMLPGKLRILDDTEELFPEPDEAACTAVLEQCMERCQGIYGPIQDQGEFHRQMMTVIESNLRHHPHKDNTADYDWCYANFAAWETDRFLLRDMVTVERVLERYPDLRERLPREHTKEMESIIASAVKQAQKPSIYYQRQAVFNEVYGDTLDRLDALEDEKRYVRNIVRGKFPITAEQKRTIARRLSALYDWKWVYEELKHLVSAGQVANGTELVGRMEGIIKRWLQFERIYLQCVPFGNSVELYISDEKERRFELRRQGKLVLSDEEEAEYLLCSALQPCYSALFYQQDGRSLKLSVEALPAFMDFAEHMRALLLETGMLTEQEGRFVYRDTGDVKAFRAAVLEMIG